MNERKSKNIVIIALCITLIFMGVGFSALSSQLTINGTAGIAENVTWNVKFTDIKAVEVVDNSKADEEKVITDETAIATYLTGSTATVTSDSLVDFNVTLAQPGDAVTYEVTVTNAGTLPAKLSALTPTLAKTDDEINQPIKYALDAPEIDAELAAGATHTYTITVTYDDSFVGANTAKEENKTRTYSLVADYVQK